jgi:ABC-2 type transport system permease protein
MTEGVVFDLGYKPHEGPTLGRSAVVRAMLRDGLRRVLGLRRRARKKVLPWGLMSIALLPVTFFVAIGVVIGELAEEAELFGHPEYFNLTSAVTIVFVALAGAELLIPDRVNGVVSVYASRPLTTADYLGARAAALAILVLGFLFLPHVVLYLGEAWVSSEGFASYLGGHIDDLWQSGLASIGYFATFAPLAFLVASLSTRTGIAAGSFIGVTVMSAPAAAALVESGIDYGGLLAIADHPGFVKDWILDANTDRWIPERAGMEPIVSLAAIAVIALVCTAIVVRRYRRMA